MDVREQGGGTAASWFLQPCLKRCASELGERRGPFLPSLAEASHMSAAAQKDGVPIEIDQLGKTQASLHGEQQQGVIAPPQPCRSIRGGEDGLDLRSVKEMDLTLVVALARYRQHTLDMSPVGRLFEGCETEEGTDGRQE